MTSTEETRFKLWHRSRSCLIWGDFSVEKSLYQNKKMAPAQKGRDTAGPHKTPFGNKESTVVGSHVEVQKVARLLSYINKSRPRLPPIQKMAGLSRCQALLSSARKLLRIRFAITCPGFIRDMSVYDCLKDNIVCILHQVRGSPKITHDV